MSTPAATSGARETSARLPGSLAANRRLSQWLRFRPDRMLEVHPGKVELGQGILTALAQIAAEELDVALARIVMVPATTASSPNESVTSGSRSVQDSGMALRYACAEARALLLQAAAAALDVPAETLSVQDGTISASNARRTTYWDLDTERLLDRDATAAVAPKAPSAHRVVGRPAPRLDLPDKVFGRPRYIHDLELPRLLHGRVLRPPSPAATLEALDDSAARAVPGVVAVVRDGSFVGVLAEDEVTALTALERLRAGARWREQANLPDANQLGEWLKAQPVETKVIDEIAPATRATPVRTQRAVYTRPFLAHASIAPSCALAQWENGKLHVWSHSQGVYNLRADLALVFKLPPAAITVEHVEGAGCYGHNGADDVALDAALLARAALGRPVRVQWSRADELTWSPVGAAMRVEVEADLDAAGEVLDWRHHIWSNGHTNRPGRGDKPALLAARHLGTPFEAAPPENPPLAGGGGAERNSVPPYVFPARRIVSHRVVPTPIRTSSLRSLGAHMNVFAAESFVDEIAAAKGEDPVAWRLRHLRDERARAVIEAAARRFGWDAWTQREGFGRGIAFARYKNAAAWCAVAAEIEAERTIRVRRLVIAVDVGQPINPDGVVHQIEGGAIQAASWTLKEAVRFDRTRLTSGSWEEYPILTFSEIPAVEVEIVARPDAPPLGAGEAAQGPTTAAIANAVYDALGARVRDLPITPERIAAAD